MKTTLPPFIRFSDSSVVHPIRLLVKSLILFIIFNLLAVAFFPPALGKLSAYNLLFPGRERFPFGENPQQAYNLSLFDVDAMFKSLALDGTPKTSAEFRVFVIGDSSVWGTLLKPEETLPGLLNAANLTACGKQVRVYNLGYPTISLTKDLMILDQAMRYQPDLIIWPTTLEAFPKNQQLVSPLLANNPERVTALMNKYGLSLDTSSLKQPEFLDKTIYGQRRNLMDLVRLQLLGVMWAATGIDQVYPSDYQPAATDLEANQSFHKLTPPNLDPAELAFDVLEAGHSAAGDVPILLVNEPMLISTGKNSDIRYNFFYPRWAYDQYRQMLTARAAEKNWQVLDLWDLLPPSEFTNSAIHLTPAGEKTLAEQIGARLGNFPCIERRTVCH